MIPHPHTGNNHQYWNAKAFESKGHEIILQKNMTESLLKILATCTAYKKKKISMKENLNIYKLIEKELFDSL
jgi:UDP-N-acetylglucosamine:LPS N-acetylglucosamine transferase